MGEVQGKSSVDLVIINEKDKHATIQGKKNLRAACLKAEFLQVMENLESYQTSEFHFQGLESHIIKVWVMETPVY